MSMRQSTGNLSFSVIDDLASFERLRNDWVALLPHADSATVFMQWEWHFTWWTVFAGQRDSLYIMTWRHQGRLVGVLPLYRHSGLLPASCCLRFIGTGESHIDEVVTEYGDLLADRSLEADLVASATDHILQFDSWQCVELLCMLGSSRLAQSIVGQTSTNALIVDAGLRYRVGLGGTEADYVASLSNSRAKRLKRSQRALEREGGIDVTVVDVVENFDQAFCELATLNHERQAHKKRKSVFASDRFKLFHHELCQRLHDEGSANIVRFHLGSRLLAVLYCFYDEQNCYYYQSGFARKDANKFTPLTVAHLVEMQRNREAGRAYYDLMRGRPPCYKDEFFCETTPMLDIALFKSSVLLTGVTAYRSLRSAAARIVKRESN